MTPSRPITRLQGTALVSLAALAVLGVAGCSDSAGGSSAPASTTPKSNDTVQVAKTDLGQTLVDSQGRTLYLFGKDAGTTSECSGACAAAWPPLTVTGTPTAGNGAKPSLTGTTTRSDGQLQVTYNGHPVYRFQKDQAAGDTNGEGLTAFGGSWFGLSPAGKQISHAPSSSGSSNNSGGFSY